MIKSLSFLTLINQASVYVVLTLASSVSHHSSEWSGVPPVPDSSASHRSGRDTPLTRPNYQYSIFPSIDALNAHCFSDVAISENCGGVPVPDVKQTGAHKNSYQLFKVNSHAMLLIR